jgi:hypothetical protein
VTVAYCSLEDIKTTLAGDVPNMGASHDRSLITKILEVSRDLDRQVALERGDASHLFSFLADQQYARQRIYFSASPAPTSSMFVLELGGQVTSELFFQADSADVQAALEALSNVGAGNVSVSGFAGGPWTVDFAGSLVGQQPVFTGDVTVTDGAAASIVVLPMWDGAELVYSERIYYPTPEAYGRLIPIDDCVDVQSVVSYAADGSTSTALSIPADCRPYPTRGLPIQGLKSTGITWPEWPETIGVTARWGHAYQIPKDAQEGVTIEVIRAHFAGQAGNDDRLGMTPFGKVITSKAYTSKFHKLVCDYGQSKLW